MMMKRRTLFALALLPLLMVEGTAHAQQQPAAQRRVANCEALANVDINKTYEADDRDIRQCIQRGWDPPISWRNNQGRSAGVRVGGAGGFNITARNPPERSPGAEGANANVSASLFSFLMGIAPRGFPCQIPGGIDLCGGSNSGGGSGGAGGGDGTGGGAGGGDVAPLCPIATDTTGLYGQQQAISGGSVPLTCGGALPLSTYFMSATFAPTGMVATEANSRQVWIYRTGSNGFEQVATAQLPSYACNAAGERVELQPPVAQMVQYNSSSGNVALRLASEYGEGIDPFIVDPEAEKVKFLVLPLTTRGPQVPEDCARDTSIIRDSTAITAPFTIESANTATCDTLTLPLGGACENNMLFAVLDRPNLIYTPGSSAGFTAMQGRTAFLATANAGTRLYAQSDTVMYFGGSGSFTLPEGGVMKLDDGSRLVMNGPATISGRNVILTGGGSIQSISGATTSTISPGGSTSPAAALPFVVKIARSVELPNGLTLPTQPAPFVRLPKSTGQ